MQRQTGTKPKSILKSPGQSPAVTRSKTSHYVFGQAGPMPENQLPTYVDLKRDFDWRKIKNSSSEAQVNLFTVRLPLN